jgi:hypothetical protein
VREWFRSMPFCAGSSIVSKGLSWGCNGPEPYRLKAKIRPNACSDADLNPSVLRGVTQVVGMASGRCCSLAPAGADRTHHLRSHVSGGGKASRGKLGRQPPLCSFGRSVKHRRCLRMRILVHEKFCVGKFEAVSFPPVSLLPAKIGG